MAMQSAAWVQNGMNSYAEKLYVAENSIAHAHIEQNVQVVKVSVQLLI